ncbi:hypothetical protein RJ53_04485 [Methanocalculus chunghsingensis]|uniref:Uncharacterized protein n=1 Tax=Methanocalculus chunghsingensis TaxID=156457 RepID=A0A8J7W5R2_9EURY|nr:hypothetical protein [Methanocalculus chunghsingensis]MBR1368806.1 hypothetical protein [Methanocalculus chunghsingensis]
MQQLTTIARPVDPSYPTNRAIIILILLVFAGTSLYRGADSPESFISGLIAGVAVFLAWAIARELDPDSEYAAFLPAVISIPLLVFIPVHGLLASLFLLLLLRVVNRTTGLPAGVLDSAALLLLSGWLVSAGVWIAGPAAVAAFLLDWRLRSGNPRQIWFAAGTLLLMLALIFLSGGFGLAGSDLPAAFPVSLLVLAAPLLFVLVILRGGPIRSPDDRGSEVLDTDRVQAARILGLSVVVVAVLVGGMEAVALLLSAWAALVGLGIYGSIRWVLK